MSAVLALDRVPPVLSPRRLVLDLLDADPESMGNTPGLLAAGQVFGFSANQMRVALSRLLAAGLLRKPRRGRYALSGEGAALREEIQGWRGIEDRRTDWCGAWCAVLVANVAAESSAQARRHTRALQLRGLRRWRPGLWVRPDNLVGGLERLTAELSQLGLDGQQGSFLITGADPACSGELAALWDAPHIEEEYRRRLADIEEACTRLRAGTGAEHLVETITLGSDTIRFLLKDPLLPEALAAGRERRALVAAMDRYDREGRRQWRQFIDSLEPRP